MGSIRAEQRMLLEEKFGKRVSFQRLERKLYGHDIAAMPRLFQPSIGNTLPDRVVRPENESEVIDLVRLAFENRISLTPRGKATSGYGGAVPLEHGLVVDFYRMKRIVDIDPEKETATIEAGVVWEKLDQELGKYGLMLKLYPTSYPSSIVGGWLAQGGAGIGSYESGWFRENALSARMVLPNGRVKEFSGSEIELVSDAEGITGLITQVDLKVQPREELQVVSLGCPDPQTLQLLIESIYAAGLPIWSLMFINSKMAELKNQAPLPERNGRSGGERVVLTS